LLNPNQTGTLLGSAGALLFPKRKRSRPVGHDIPFRTSPVFPLCTEFHLPALGSGVFYLYLLSFDPAFPVLARIAQKAPTELRCGFLFSLGLASVLCVTREARLLESIEALASQASETDSFEELLFSIIFQLRVIKLCISAAVPAS